jgi:hypothetical protein
MADVDVVLVHPWRDKEVNERLSLDADLAAELVRSGTAVAATVADAKAVGADADDAATKRK